MLNEKKWRIKYNSCQQHGKKSIEIFMGAFGVVVNLPWYFAWEEISVYWTVIVN